MRARSLIRAALVLVVIAVVAVIAVSWEERPELASEEETGAQPVEDDVVSTTLGLHHVAQVNGRVTYEVSADEAVSSTGNRYEYRGNVELVLRPPEAGDDGEAEPTRVRGERMTLVERPVPIEGDAYEEIRLRDEVRAMLPDGVEFLSDVLTYRDGDLRTDAGVRLYVGGLVIESRGLRYDHQTRIGSLRQAHPETQRPGLRGPVRLWSDGGAGKEADAGFELQGNAGEILFDLALSELTLRNDPELVLAEARLSGADIVLGLVESTGEIEGIVAEGNAHAVWLAPTAPGDHIATGETISVDMVDGQARGLRVASPGASVRPRFELGEAGDLRADTFELGFGDTASLAARGDAYFFPHAGDAGLEHIHAGSLTTGAGRLDRLTADRDVEILLAGGAEPVAIRGPRAVVVYRDDAIESAEWPAGIRHEGEDGRELSAGHGTLDPDTGNWVLDGDPRPRLKSADVDVEADTVELLADGGIHLVGAVDARLSGEMIRTVAPLFGNASQIEASADELRVGSDDRLEFQGNAGIWGGDGQYLMQANEIKLLVPTDELQATGNVFVNLLEERPGDAEARTVVLTGGALLVEGAPLALVMVDTALLELEGEKRTIGGNRLEVHFGDNGTWEAVNVFGNVAMSDPAGTGRGDRLEYDAETGLVVIYAGASMPATFAPNEGIDIRDREGLRLAYDGDNLSITAMQNGTTTTVRGSQR